MAIIPGVKRIAVFRPNAVGDFVFALPALHALKTAYPEAELIYLGKPWHAEFLVGRPGPVDRTVVVPPVPGMTARPGEGDPAAVEAFVARMRALDLDLAIQLYGGGKQSNPFVRRTARAPTSPSTAPRTSAPLVGEVMEHMDAPALDVAGRLSVSGLLGLIERCALLVSNDTGPLHLAQAIGTPTVGIYWLTNLLLAGPFDQKTNRAAVSYRIDCPVCGQPNVHSRCGHDPSYVDEVEVDTVEEMALDLLGQRQ